MAGPAQPPAKLPALSDETIRLLIEQQGKDVTLRSQELSIRKQELDYQSKHASDILSAQERDREMARKHSRTTARDKLIFAAVALVLVIGFAAWGLFMNKDAIVKDVLQIALSAVVGALGGYGYANQKIRGNEKDEDDS